MRRTHSIRRCFRARLADLGDDYADGTIERAEYRRLSTRLRERIADGEERLAQTHATGPAINLVGHGKKLRRAWDAMTVMERREVIEALVEQIICDPAIPPRNVFRAERLRPVWRF